MAVLLLLLYQAVELGIGLLAVVIAVPVANLLVPSLLILVLRLLLAVGAALAATRLGPVPSYSRWHWCVAALAPTVGGNHLWARGYRTTFVETYRIPTGAMEPTILSGDYLLATKWAYGWREPFSGRVVSGARRPERGELLVFRYPEDRTRAFIKRCIGLPGETVEIRGRIVLIDRKPLNEAYAHFLRRDGAEEDASDLRRNWGPALVPPGSYFVLGDNRDNSKDSRYWGFVEDDDLLGRAVVVSWSIDSAGPTARWQRIGRRLE
jgi:signal peptidase I